MDARIAYWIMKQYGPAQTADSVVPNAARTMNSCQMLLDAHARFVAGGSPAPSYDGVGQPIASQITNHAVADKADALRAATAAAPVPALAPALAPAPVHHLTGAGAGADAGAGGIPAGALIAAPITMTKSLITPEIPFFLLAKESDFSKPRDLFNRSSMRGKIYYRFLAPLVEPLRWAIFCEKLDIEETKYHVESPEAIARLFKEVKMSWEKFFIAFTEAIGEEFETAAMIANILDVVSPTRYTSDARDIVTMAHEGRLPSRQEVETATISGTELSASIKKWLIWLMTNGHDRS